MNDYTGICLIVGSSPLSRKMAANQIKELYPEAILMSEPDDATDALLSQIDAWISHCKNEHKHYIITTNNVLVIRAVECICDEYYAMNDLNVYDLDENTDIDKCRNLTYYEYGMSGLYDKFSCILNGLQSRTHYDHDGNYISEENNR